jgi:leucyl/phenylalanyl-tRNA---protein transferase
VVHFFTPPRLLSPRPPGDDGLITTFRPVPIYRLASSHRFPEPSEAEGEGLLAVGGDLHPARLLEAYSRGIFPWFNEGDPILWWSPPERTLWLPGDFRPSANFRKSLRRAAFEVRVDTAFEAVIRGCASTPRPGLPGTWIGEGMIAAYLELHRRGYGHSFEAWKDGELAGGLYGLALGAAFFGESMFSLRADASKAAFQALCQTVFGWGFHFIDGQLANPHLARLGARTVTREDYLARLAEALERPAKVGTWALSALPQVMIPLER